MALENKAQKIKREALEALPRIAMATNVDPFYTFCSNETAAWLLKNGYIEQNDQIKNESDHLATRATQKGIEFAATLKPIKEDVQVTEEAKNEAVEFVIEDVALPAAKRGGNLGGYVREGKYKKVFDALQVGQTFFVPGKDTKAMASTVANQNKRFAVEKKDENGVVVMRKNRKGKEVAALVYERKFAVRVDEKDGVKGVRIGRTI